MYPAITLTILILMLLHASVNNRNHQIACRNGLEDENEINANCSTFLPTRPEIRDLSVQQITNLIRVFNSTNLTEKLNLKFGTVRQNALNHLLDTLLENSTSTFLMPYWDYRLDYNLPVPLDSILFHVEPFKSIGSIQSNDIATNENLNVEKWFKSATETIYDLKDKTLWMKRKNAYDMLEQLNSGVLWKILFYMTVENEMDVEDKWQQPTCDLHPYLFWHRDKNLCISKLAVGRRCVGYEKFHNSCYNSECLLRKCRFLHPTSTTTEMTTTTTVPTTTTTFPPMTTPSVPSTHYNSTTKKEVNFLKDPLFDVLKKTPIEIEFDVPLNFTIESITDNLNKKPNESQTFVADMLENVDASILPTDPSTKTTPMSSSSVPTEATTTIETTIELLDVTRQPKKVYTTQKVLHNPTSTIETLLLNADKDNLLSSTAKNEYSTTTLKGYYEKRRKERKKNRKNRNKKYEQQILEEEIRKLKGQPKERDQEFGKKKHRRRKHRPTSTTPPITPSIMRTTMRPIVFPASDPQSITPPTTKIPIFIDEIVPFTEANWIPMPPANEDTNLDSLLSLLPTPSVPEGTIKWNDNTTPFDMVYFTITVVEGSMSRKEPPKKKAIGARVYLMGLNMPNGYTQITEGMFMKRGTGALVRTLNPEIAGPFVEFKIRVENRYGSPCKQMCLDSKQRYRRCARRVMRLSAYKKFSDPIIYYKNSTMAMNSQWTGRGYYRKRKLDYILFKCE